MRTGALLSVPLAYPDKTMGCPQEGEQPVLEPVDAWLMVVQLEDPVLEPELLLEYRVRADDGSVRYCEHSQITIETPAPTPRPT